MCPLGNLKESLSNLNNLRKQLNIKQMAEDTASFIIRDLNKAGYNAKLEKNNSKKPKNWKITPTDTLTQKQKEEFERIKKEKQDLYLGRTQDSIKQMRNALIGKKW